MRFLRYSLLAVASVAAIAGDVCAGNAVDLSSWVSANVPGPDGPGVWTIQAGNDSVIQEVSGLPTFFYESGTNAQETILSGKIRVLPDTSFNDDDFIGFALGVDAGEIGSTNTDFILVDWKQATQDFAAPYGLATIGMSLSHVTDASQDFPFWNHLTTVNEIQRATTLGSAGWVDDQEYDFELVFTSQLIQVRIDGMLELSVTPADAGLLAFDDGSFSLYNYSQTTVLYSVIEQAAITISVLIDVKPGSFPNSVNPMSKGVLPVAILGTADFDVNEVDFDTLMFGDPLLINSGGTAVSPLRSALEDVSGDGLLDLTLKFSTRDLVEFGALGSDTIEGILIGLLKDGTQIEGLDSIRIVPPNGSKGNNLQISAVPEPTTSALALAALCLAMSRHSQTGNPRLQWCDGRRH